MFMITMPVIVIYWQSAGLGIMDIFILQVIYSVAWVLFEVPSGWFADRYGYKLSILLGTILSTVGYFVFWGFPVYEGFIVGEIILALSAGFVSGARDALLYDTLEAMKRVAMYTKVQGRQFAAGNISEAVAALAAGVVAYIYSVETVILIQGIIAATSIFFAFKLKMSTTEKESYSDPFFLALKMGCTHTKSCVTSTFFQLPWEPQSFAWCGLCSLCGVSCLCHYSTLACCGRDSISPQPWVRSWHTD